MERHISIDVATFDADVAAQGYRKRINDELVIVTRERSAFLGVIFVIGATVITSEVYPCHQRQGVLPERFGDAVQLSVEAALGRGLYIAVADEKSKRGLLVSDEESGGNGGDGHYLGG